jgi:protein gp37
MSTKIEWCDETINPIIGCTKISEGCQECYAEKMANRLAKIGHSRARYSQVITNGKWNGNVDFDEKVFYKPKKWKSPKKIFITSMGDLFHDAVFDSWLVDILFIIAANPQHTFIMLTKRPQRMNALFTNCGINPFFELLPNLWLGVTVENQKQAEIRIPILLNIPAVIHFISCEPLLSNLNLNNWLSKIDWVIAGGENGPKAKLCHPDWIRSLRDQCKLNEVPFFFKGYGDYWAKTHLGFRHRKSMGYLIDNIEYQQFPKLQHNG